MPFELLPIMSETDLSPRVQWSICFICTLVFLLGCEAWKFCKRVYYRRTTKPAAVEPLVTDKA